MKQFPKRQILPTITTTRRSDWKARIKEINELGLKEAALFPTCLDKKERKKLYQLLKKSTVKSIPLVHLKDDMPPEELDYLVENYKTKVFCNHTKTEHPPIYDYPKYRKIICIENVFHPLNEKEIRNFGGICLDLSHLENDRILRKEIFKHNLKILKKYPIIANHISSVKKVSRIVKRGIVRYDSHLFKNLSEFDYLKKYPKDFFSPLIAIESENSIKEQLLAINYIVKIVDECF